MGQYATILGEQVKLTGLIVKAAKECGISVDDGVTVISRGAVKDVLGSMVRELESPRTLVSADGRIASYDLRNLAQDAHIASVLINWLVNSEEDGLIFA